MTDQVFRALKGMIFTSVPLYITQATKFISALSGNQPGDTRKGAEVILDLVRGDGVAKGKEVPKSLVLGSDCFNAVEGICKAELQALTEWKEVIISTDVPKSPSIFDQLVA